MSQSISNRQSQEQDNLIKDTNVSGDLNFAPVQVDNQTVNNITNNHYVSQINSEEQIHARKLIKGSPYLGLEKFDVEDSDKFFGRDRWIVELTDYLEKENVLLLLGASGSGKSSLIQAGLIPKLKDQGNLPFLNFAFVPDVDPFESFYGCLLTKYKQSEAKTARGVAEDTLVKVVESLKKEDTQWLIFIDQFEELFTRTPQKERDIFVKSLIKLIDKNDPTVKLVMTMRADFLDKLGPYPALGRIHDHHSRMLTDMEESDLRLAIAEPAARNGVTFERGLIEQIIADFRQQAGSLPLLQYTLDLLWRNDDIQDRVLNQTTYKNLGGVTGALQQQANKIYSELDELEQKAAEQIFLELIVLEGKEPVSRRADQSSFKEGTIEATVLSKLIDNRLLVSKGEEGKATVEAAHEALLRSWQVLQNLIREKEEIIVLKNRLYADAKNWEDTQKASSELWTGSKLGRVVELRNEKALANLDALAMEFIDASLEERDRQQKAELERQKRDKRTAQGIAIGSLGALVISSGLGLMAWQKTKQAEYNQAESLGRYSLSLLNENKGLEAFVQAIKSGKILQKQRTINDEVTEALQKALVKVREFNSFKGYGDLISSVSFSPDGKTLASSSSDGTIKLWNVETGEEVYTLNLENFTSDGIDSIRFSPDSKTLVSAGRIIQIWNVETGKKIRTHMGQDEYIDTRMGHDKDISFSPDSKTLASSSDGTTIKLWNVETGKEIRTLKGGDSSVQSVSFSLDGKILAAGSGDKTIKLWDVKTGEKILTLKGDNSLVQSVSFCPDGKTLASGNDDGTIKIWDVKTGKKIRTLKGDNSLVESVSFSPDGKTLASGSDDGTIKLWDVKRGKEILTLKGHNWAVKTVSFSPDGKTLASGSADSIVKLWDVEKEKEIRTFADDHNLPNVSFSADGKTLASNIGGGIIKLWNLKTGQAIQILNIGYGDFGFGSDGKTLASLTGDGTIKFWDLRMKMKKPIRSFKLPAIFSPSFPSAEFFGIDFTPDLKTLASITGDGTIKLWNLEKGEKTHIIPVVNSSQLSKDGSKNRLFMSFSPDSKILASINGYDGTMKLWNIKTGKEIRTFTGRYRNIHYVSFSADGNRLVTGNNNGMIKIWNVKTGQQILALTENNESGDDNYFNGLIFNPDGKTLAVIRQKKKEIELWDLEKQIKFRTLVEYEDNYRSDSTVFNNIQFSPDGKILVSIDNDGTLKLWNGSNGWDLDALMERSCDRIRNYLLYNSNVSESDRHLCDDISTQQ